MGRKTKPLPFEDLLIDGVGDKRLEVLRAIAQTGSISQAARVTGVSYKAGWQAVETLSNLAGVPLLDKLVGGSGGGGARLTAQGQDLLRAADLMRSARQQALARLRKGQPQGSVGAGTLAAVGLRTSMRNQLPCKVRSLSDSSGVVRVVMALPDGQNLTSRITRESGQLLGLRVGMPVLALCKATAVTVAPHILALSGVNLLTGAVARIAGSSGSREVALQMASGLFVVGLADPEAGLKRRQRAMAAFEESAVVIGLMD
jgi:molybdate transport system regulatory protein